MKTIKHSTGKLKHIFLYSLLMLLGSAQAFAYNPVDSDLSNQAGSNGSWHNIFWFLACVAFLIAAAIIGSKNKYKPVTRKYNKGV